MTEALWITTRLLRKKGIDSVLELAIKLKNRNAVGMDESQLRLFLESLLERGEELFPIQGKLGDIKLRDERDYYALKGAIVFIVLFLNEELSQSFLSVVERLYKRYFDLGLFKEKELKGLLSAVVKVEGKAITDIDDAFKDLPVDFCFLEKEDHELKAFPLKGIGNEWNDKIRESVNRWISQNDNFFLVSERWDNGKERAIFKKVERIEDILDGRELFISSISYDRDQNLLRFDLTGYFLEIQPVRAFSKEEIIKYLLDEKEGLKNPIFGERYYKENYSKFLDGLTFRALLENPTDYLTKEEAYAILFHLKTFDDSMLKRREPFSSLMYAQ